MFEALKYNLKNNRKHVIKSATAWFLFGAIIVVFVLWGMNPRDQGVAQGGAAATVNNVTISLAQYSEVMERLRRDPRFEQLQALGGDAGRQILQQQALSQLIEFELINQATKREHLVASDGEVRDILIGIPAFQDNGVFKRDLYRAYLAQSRKSDFEFEDEIRREQSLRRVVKAFSMSLAPMKIEKDMTESLKTIKADLEFVSVPTETLVGPESIAGADIKAFEAKDGSDAKISDYYASHKPDFSSPEKVKARHILIRATAGDADAEKAALAKIEDIARKAKTQDFAKLAAQFSEDPGSKAKGGLIDYFARGRMVPEFENAAFALAPGTLSQPIKTEYGYHLIQVLDKKPALDRSLDQVKEEIAGILIAKDRSRAAIEGLQEALKKGDQAAVQRFVAEHKLKWEETGAFSVDAQAIPKIGPNDEIMQMAFQLSEQKPMPESLIRDGARALVVRYRPVQASKAPDAKKPESEDAVVAMANARRAEASLRNWLDDLRKSAKISTNPRLSNPAL